MKFAMWITNVPANFAISIVFKKSTVLKFEVMYERQI